jgi:hypothetical protein
MGSWLLLIWLVGPQGGVTKETINGFETKIECFAYGMRYRNIELLRRVEFLCQAAEDSTVDSIGCQKPTGSGEAATGPIRSDGGEQRRALGII